MCTEQVRAALKEKRRLVYDIGWPKLKCVWDAWRMAGWIGKRQLLKRKVAEIHLYETKLLPNAGPL
eukprot:1263737-Prorocentrum_lima.AAC.1